MRPFSALFSASIALGFLCACATAGKAPEPIVLAGLHFDYSIEGRENVQLIQVFDDGSRTYPQFREPPVEPVAIEGGSDKTPLGYLVDGPYLILAGVYEQLRVSVGERSAEVREISAEAKIAMPATSSPVAASGTAQR